MTTLTDIAKKSGFSKTLVSRAINNEYGVSEESRAKILSVAKELNYRPNLLAKALTTNKLNTIAVVLESLTEPFYFDFIKAIEERAQEENYKVLFCSPNDSTEVKSKYIEYFTQGTTDGIIIYSCKKEDETYIKSLADTKFPLVVVESELEDKNINSVQIDNYGGSTSAVEYLIDQGHKIIYHFRGDHDKQVSHMRCKAYKSKMKKSGLEDYIRIIDSDFTEKSGYDEMMKLIKSNDIPEAIFFSGDATAVGAMEAIIEYDKNLLSKIRLIGFDEDVKYKNMLFFPKLSTVKQPMADVGRAAAEILIKQINDREGHNIVKVFEPQLIIKET